MKLTVVNQNTDFWDNFSDTAYPPLSSSGYTLFVKIGFPTVFKRVIYSDGQPQSNSEVGYTFVQEVPPNAGFSNTGNTINWAVDAGTKAVADHYGIPYTLSFAQMSAIDFSLIDEADLRVMFKDNVFTDWAVQPYESEPLKDNTGDILYDSNGEKLYPLKEF